MKQIIIANFVLLVFVLGLSSCMVGSKYSKPEIQSPASYSEAASGSNIDVAHWGELYQDPHLVKLLKAVYKHNHNLAALYQRVLQSRAIIESEKSQRRPRINGDAGFRRYEDSEALEIFDAGTTQDEYSLGLTVGWELDVFGRTKRLVNAAKAEAQATQLAYQDLLLITQTDAAIHYFRLAALSREIKAVERGIEIRQETLEASQQRFESGSISDLQVAQHETLLAQAQAELAVLLRAYDVRENAIAVLTGQSATQFTAKVAPIKGVAVKVPVSLPSDLLERRPDLRQAERELAAKHEEIGYIKASMYPRISIGGSGGVATLDAANWFKKTAGFYSVGPTVYIPIFQGGRLRAELTRTEYAYLESLELYQQAILEAFAEVEDALSGWKYLKQQRSAQDRATQSAIRAQSIAKKQYDQGVIDFITSLDVERTALDAERRLAQVIGDEYENSVLLIRSLGGTWGKVK